MSRESRDEWDEVRHVVDDVMTDRDIADRRDVGDRRPVSQHGLHLEIAEACLVDDDIEHPLLMVDAHNLGRRWSEAEYPTPATASNIKDRW